MYGIFTYVWVIFRANVGKYSIHGAYGYVDVVLLRMDAGAGNGQFPYQFLGDAPNGNVVIAMSVLPSSNVLLSFNITNVGKTMP